MKWQMILPLVALLTLALIPQAAEAHHHHHCWNNGMGYGRYGNMGYGGYGMNPYGYGGGGNPYGLQRVMYGGSPYGYGGYGGYGGSPYGYGNGGAMMSTMGRLLRGF